MLNIFGGYLEKKLVSYDIPYQALRDNNQHAHYNRKYQKHSL